MILLADPIDLLAPFLEACGLDPFAAPWIASGRLYATDGSLMLRGHAVDHPGRLRGVQSDPPHLPDLGPYFDHWQPTGIVATLPDDDVPPDVPCPRCSGLTPACATCFGVGTVLNSHRIRIGHRVGLAGFRVAWLKALGVEGVEIGVPRASDGRPAAVRFRGDGYEGLLNPLVEECR
jgi:hypothetical protein